MKYGEALGLRARERRGAKGDVCSGRKGGGESGAGEVGRIFSEGMLERLALRRTAGQSRMLRRTEIRSTFFEAIMARLRCDLWHSITPARAS